jgi:glyoxylase-like metal-dependent hydrolase (beta-lactamase superfamily II)
VIVDRYELGPIGTNCYVVRADRGAPEAVVIDPGGDAAELRIELARMGATCAGILVTHCHWDHIGGVADLAEGTGAPVSMSAIEAPVLEDPDSWYASVGVKIRPWSPEVRLAGDESFELAGISWRTLFVPGHSPGHVAFAAGEAVFSGDVLFAGGVGRIDLPGGDWETLLGSIRTLAAELPPDTVVYSGHGPPTTLGQELATNPFLDELRAAS